MKKEAFYTTIEVQRWANGSGQELTDFYQGTDENGITAEERAYGKLYAILNAAATSGLPYHAGWILRSDGIVIDGNRFDRRSDSEADSDTESEEA